MMMKIVMTQVTITLYTLAIITLYISKGTGHIGAGKF